MNLGIFSNEILLRVNRLFVLVYSNRNYIVKRFKANIYYIAKGITKYYNVIINGKSFYDQATDTKRYEEVRKLTTGQGEDYTTRYLLDYDYIKIYYRLIAVDLVDKIN